jgi:hypothetical protein
MAEPQNVPNAVPSPGKLVAATVGALLVAGAVLVTTVLPAEYGLDPLGTGAALGLTPLGEAGQAAAAPPVVLNPADQPGGHNAQATEFRRDAVSFTLGPREGMEYKYRLAEGGSMVYSWRATANVNYDMHSEPDSGPRGYAETFDKEDGRDHAFGAYTAPFPGIHGWYWENPTRFTVTVQLTTAGFYENAIEFRAKMDPKVTWFE